MELADIKDNLKEELDLLYPLVEGWDSNPYAPSHKGLDFGWIKNPTADILSCADGIVDYEGFYSETIKGKEYRPIGVIMRHPQFFKDYDLISIYWHLSRTVIDKGMKIKKGQVIGKRGCSGFTDPPNAYHLHFQLLIVPKGAEVPRSYKWKEISIDPTDLLTVYPDQIFDYSGNFNLKRASK